MLQHCKARELLSRFERIEWITHPRNNSGDPSLRACCDHWGKWYLASMHYTEKNRWQLAGPFDSREALLDHVAGSYIWALHLDELHPEYVTRLERMTS